jgi:hypothetical protein
VKKRQYFKPTLCPQFEVDHPENRRITSKRESGLLKTHGAGNGIRTRDTKLGKLVLYQLSYARKIKTVLSPDKYAEDGEYDLLF